MPVTTTHDPHGGGRPRLIFAFNGFTQSVQARREFDLLPGVTTIGSAPGADLCLAGLDAQHAEIRRDDSDEYTYFHLGGRFGSTVHGGFVGEALLRTSAIIVAGGWTMAYYREEYADHGRPYGGRSGGELSRQRRQQRPRMEGSTVTGGSDPNGADPGEYFRPDGPFREL